MCILERKQVAVKLGLALVVQSQARLEDPALLVRQGVAEFVGSRINAPAVLVKPHAGMHGGALREVIVGAQGERVAGARARVNLGLETVPGGIRGIFIAHRTIGIVQVTLVGNGLEGERHDQVAREHLRQAQSIAAHLGGFLELIVAVLQHGVIADSETDADGGQVAKHVLRHADAQRRCVVIAFLAVGEGQADRAFLPQVIDEYAVFLASFGVRTGADEHVDRCAGNLVDIVIQSDRDAVAQVFANQQRGAVYFGAAPVVAVIQQVGAFLGQYRGLQARAQQQ